MIDFRPRLRALATSLSRVSVFVWDATDLRDCLFVVGVVLAWYGGSKVSWPWSCVAVGLLFVSVALFGIRPTGGTK